MYSTFLYTSIQRERLAIFVRSRNIAKYDCANPNETLGDGWNRSNEFPSCASLTENASSENPKTQEAAHS